LATGSNENTNGLLRQYLPKGIDISGYSQLKLNAIAQTIEREAAQDARLPDTR
jgi:IS30 family transposase